MRNASFTLTQPQMRDGSKTVTRRLGWASARPGQWLMACPKCQGLGRGGVMERIHPIVVESNRPEPLRRMIDEPEYGAREARLEGFPHLDGAGFVAMFCGHMKVEPRKVVNRLAFRHVFPHEWIILALRESTRTFADEIRLQDEIAGAFTRAGIPYQREVRVTGGRVDFLVLGHVAVEVKRRGSGLAAARQSIAYLEDPRVTRGVIISAAPVDLPLSSYLAADGRHKPLHLVELWRNAL